MTTKQGLSEAAGKEALRQSKKWSKDAMKGSRKNLKIYFWCFPVHGFVLAIDITKVNENPLIFNYDLIKPMDHVRNFFLKPKF